MIGKTCCPTPATWLFLVPAILGLSACEAPLDLEQVEQEATRSVHRFDHFKGLARNGSTVVAVAERGTLLVLPAGSTRFHRIEFDTPASFMAVTTCPDGRFVALDSRRTVRISDDAASNWQSVPVPTEETLMSLACDREGRIWVGASFSTLLHSDDDGRTWKSQNQEEDLQFTALQALADGTVVAAGEFGTVMFSSDGGTRWERTEPIPDDFYPLGIHFLDRQQGWVCGLGGTVWRTTDGGRSWSMEETDTVRPLYGFTELGERIFLLGDNGTLLERRGQRWQRVTALTGVTPYLIAAVSLDDSRLLLAGGSGTLLTVEVGPAGEGADR